MLLITLPAMNAVNASIITIGDELLIGQTVDTNSAWMATELNKIGVWVHRRVAVGDVWDDIWNALDHERKQSDLVLVTGGLGPTADDITKPLLCKYFGGKLVVNEKVLQHIVYLFEKIYQRPTALLERNRKQAEVPDSCQVLMNERGTAPGMMFKCPHPSGAGFTQLVFSLPGVPAEMMGLMTKDVLPLIQQHYVLPVILHRSLLTAGVGESVIAETINDWEKKLPEHLKLAYLPQFGMVRLRITGKGTNEQELANEIEKEFSALKQLVKKWLVVDEDITLPQALARMLKDKNQTVGTAESCTGGYIAHLLSRDPGSSNHYRGSVVSYHNEVKEDVLRVQKDTIARTGAVSKDTVTEMAKGGLQQLKTDYIIATSGIMGPDGGTTQKPVGLVWIAVGNRNKIITKEFHLRFHRSRNIEQAALTALNMLREFIAVEG